MPTLSCVVLSTLALSVSLAAQRTWIVDVAQRPGFDFIDLPEALIAARDGDVLILRNTANRLQWPDYTATTTNKGVTILGEVGVRVYGQLTVAGLPSGRAFSLSGVTLNSGLHLSWCSAPVHLERVTTSGQILIDGCQYVSIVNTTFLGGYSVRIPYGSADVTIIDCALSGTVEIEGVRAAPHILVSGSVILGPILDYGQGNAPLIIAGGRSTTIAANIDWHGPLTIDPTAQILGTITGRQPIMQRIPALSALGAPPGQPISTSVRSPAGDTAVLLVSIPTTRTPTPFGDLWIDPGQILFATGGVQGAGEQLDFVIPTPASAPRGIVLGLQALAGPGFNLLLSNPSVVVIN